jgi:hypothetical protein
MSSTDENVALLERDLAVRQAKLAKADLQVVKLALNENRPLEALRTANQAIDRLDEELVEFESEGLLNRDDDEQETDLSPDETEGDGETESHPSEEQSDTGADTEAGADDGDDDDTSRGGVRGDDLDTGPRWCGQCGAQFDNKRGVKVHTTRTHGGSYDIRETEPEDVDVPDESEATDGSDGLGEPVWCGVCGAGPFDSLRELSGHHAGAGHDGGTDPVDDAVDDETDGTDDTPDWTPDGDSGGDEPVEFTDWDGDADTTADGGTTQSAYAPQDLGTYEVEERSYGDNRSSHPWLAFRRPVGHALRTPEAATLVREAGEWFIETGTGGDADLTVNDQGHTIALNAGACREVGLEPGDEVVAHDAGGRVRLEVLDEGGDGDA